MTATTCANLTDGRVALLRPLDSSDRERIVAAFDRLSEESRYRRFFAPLHQLSDRSLEYLTDIDHSDHEAIIALDPATDELIGVARYVRGEPDSDRAEAAVVVADDWQHVGPGRALLERLGAALGAALRAAAGSIFGVRSLSERLLRAARELWEIRRPGP